MVRAGLDHYKVGVAASVSNRISALQTSNANKIELVTAHLVTDAHSVERKAHDKLKKLKTEGGKEWFKLDDAQALDIAIFINKFEEATIADSIVGLIRKEVKKALNNYDTLLQSKIELNKAEVESLRGKKKIAEILPKPEPVFETIEPNEDTLKAKEIIMQHGKASTSLLQRKMSIGYGRAARIMDNLEEEGFISEPDGARARQLL